MDGPGSYAIPARGVETVLELADARYYGAREVELVEGHGDVVEVVGVCVEDGGVLYCAPVRNSPVVFAVEHAACLGADSFVDQEEGWEVMERELADVGVIIVRIHGCEGGFVGLDFEIDK